MHGEGSMLGGPLAPGATDRDLTLGAVRNAHGTPEKRGRCADVFPLA